MAERRKVRRIGIMTGGGDCPGLNAVIRVVTRAAISKLGIEVYGIEDGFLGLIRNRMRPLTHDDVSNILTAGGTILGTSNKADPSHFATSNGEDGQPIFEDVTSRVLEHASDNGLDGIVCIGGDGTMTGAARLVERGLPFIGVPKTIDNDLMHTDLTFGFTTAVQTATECIDKIHSTASSHHRVMLIELMGRNAGWLTLHAGLAGGCDVILIPEIPFSLDAVAAACERRSRRGKRFTLIAVAEGAAPAGGQQVVNKVVHDSPDPVRLGGISTVLCEELAHRIHRETRATILGHVQRGGTPVAFDRVLASHFGYQAVELIAAGEWNRMIVRQAGRTGTVPLAEVAGRQRTVPPDDPLVAMARAVGTSMGDA